MLVLDLQGHELSVLRGLGRALQAFTQCKCEISRVPIYEGGEMFGDTDSHMRILGFRLVSHLYFWVPRHGDVLYFRD